MAKKAICPECYAPMWRAGRYTHYKKPLQRYKCSKCHFQTVYPLFNLPRLKPMRKGIIRKLGEIIGIPAK